MKNVLRIVGGNKLKKEITLILFCTAIFLTLSQDCWAVRITHQSGSIYAETGTNYMGGYVGSAEGWEASGGVFTDPTLFDDKNSNGIGAYGYASGQKINGDSGSNHARFILSSTAQSSSGKTGQGFDTYAIVRSGPNPGDMIEFLLTPDPGEEGSKIELTAQAVLAGTLNSSGYTIIDPSLDSGTAKVDFLFEIYKDPKKDPISSFSYSSLIKNEAPTEDLEKSTKLPGFLGSKKDSCKFKTGDILYVYFEQISTATVSSDIHSSAKAFAVQSTNDVITIAIEATTCTPEPSTLILLSIALIGMFSAGGISINKG